MRTPIHPRLTVAETMLTQPAVHRAWTTVGELREFFEDEHVHAALIVYAEKLLGVVERGDLAGATSGRTPALAFARLDGRTIGPDASLVEARAAMRVSGRRRLAVVGEDSSLLGLLSLKASGRGFCRDADVASRRRQGARSSDQITTSSRSA